MKALKYAIYALVATALTATSVSTAVLYSKVRELQKTAITPALDYLLSNGEGSVPDIEAPVDEEKEPSPVIREMVIRDIKYSGSDEIKLFLSDKPDMDVIRHYVTAEPLVDSALSFQWTRDWCTLRGSYGHYPCLAIRGNFAYQTNVTLTVRKGLPADGRQSSSNLVVRALAEDFINMFRRNDESPKISFADKGRYLPPAGSRSVMLSSINVPTIHTKIRRVPSANIVGLLALEEDVYNYVERSRWIGEETFVTDLSGEPLEGTLPTANRLNMKESTPLRLVPPDGGSSNGVFLVSASIKPSESNRFESDWRHRVVCLSDIGISVRKDDRNIYVWTASLTDGKPFPGAVIEVYSSANILIAKGVADGNGWCVPERVGKGRPFAVVATSSDGSDRSFIALTERMNMDNDRRDASREKYLAANDVSAFVWTDRGIYRHGEKILVHAILRNGDGVAPQKFPMELTLVSPYKRVVARKSGIFADEFGTVTCEDFSVGADLPSGKWTVNISVPGDKGAVLGSRCVKIEEFAPPTVRVKVAAAKNVKPEDFSFSVSAEHLYGGPAAALACDAAVVFEDEPFAPEGWKGWSFGSEERGLAPTFNELSKAKLDAQGRATFSAPLNLKSQKPKAAVKATAQGSVIEPGGRPATARDSAVLHCYPFYIGSDLENWISRTESEQPEIKIACVGPDGNRVAEAKRLFAKLEIIERVYSYCRGADGWATWHDEEVRSTVTEKIPVDVSAGSDAAFTIPAKKYGEYVLTVEDPATGVAFSKSFHLSDWGDDVVRAPLENPTKVAVSTDKPFYRVGETPRLVVKSPFAGTALLTVIRDTLVYSEVISLTNATSEIVLRPTEKSWSPNVEVRLSVVAGVSANAKGLAARAHGGATVVVRPAEREIPVALSTEKETGRTASENHQETLAVTLNAPGADRAVVTVVDEGINILTDEKTPDPVGFFATPRTSELASGGLFDLYNRLLPVIGEDVLKAGGVKTGGGCCAEMLGRVSPVPSRRFTPLSMWRKEIEVKDGTARAEFALPEFVGEVRVTAVAYSANATGSTSVQRKICPNIVMEPDAPRFAAPGDIFRVTLPLDNRSGKKSEVSYRIEASAVSDGTVTLPATEIAAGSVSLDTDERTVLKFRAKAPHASGEMSLKFVAEGCGERHERTIHLPVRPAMPWRETAGVTRLDPGDEFALPYETATNKFRYSVSGTPVAELRAAYDWLAEYPHGCLEQTSSRIFPLLYSTFAKDERAEAKRAAAVEAGVARVMSMVRENDFVMWPDANYAPWDREVSLYAAHFLVESAVARGKEIPAKPLAFLKKWAMSATNSVSAYACHTLAIAGAPERDRMFRLYDDRANLDLLSRARLARAFVRIHGRSRAEELLRNAESPDGVKEAAFLMLAILDLDPDDARLPSLATYLLSERDKKRFSWGTTETNAHALLALGAYYRAHPPTEGTPATEVKDGVLRNCGSDIAFVTWKRLDLPSITEDRDETTDLSIKREYFTSDWKPYDLANAKASDTVNIRLTLKSNVARDYADLVIEDLFPAAFEAGGVPCSLDGIENPPRTGWVMRSDARDDRMLVFSKKFTMGVNDEVHFTYQVRVVSPGEFALPGVAVEGMYHPALRARRRGGRIVVRD